MPTRRLPQTDEKRSQALNTCASKAASTGAPQWLITTAQNTTLTNLRTPWNTAHSNTGSALSTQTNRTALVTAALADCARCISHFIQVLNLAVERRILPASDRALYQLPVGHAEVPDINTVADCLLWSARLDAGEAARTGDGGEPLAWPAIGEVTASATTLTASENAQSTAKDNYDNLQEAIALQRPAVDALILDLWDTIEYNLRHEPAPSSLRRKAREWGVIYINDDGTEETDEPAPPPAPPTP